MIGSAVKQIAEAAPSEYEAALAGKSKVADSLSDSVFVPGAEPRRFDRANRANASCRIEPAIA